jgi:hypothetical protein
MEDVVSTETGESAPWRHSVETRLAMLEAGGEQLGNQLTEQRGVTTSMDTDVTGIQREIRAQRGMLQALHLTQQEHTAAFRHLRVGQQELERRLGQEFRQGHAKVLASVQALVSLLKPEAGCSSNPDPNSGNPE